jgi:hypothetical protein
MFVVNKAVQQVRRHDGALRMRCYEDCICSVKVVQPILIGQYARVQSITRIIEVSAQDTSQR